MKKLVLVLAVALVTQACEDKREDRVAGPAMTPGPIYPNAGGNPGFPGGHQGGHPNGYGWDVDWNEQHPMYGSTELFKLNVGQSALRAVRTTQGHNRDNLEMIRLTCRDTLRDVQNTFMDGIVLLDGSRVALLGNQSRRKPHAFVTCSDGVRKDERFDRNANRDERRLRMGETTTLQIVSTRNQFRRNQTVSVVVNCSQNLRTAVTQNHEGITMTEGSRLVIPRTRVRGFESGALQFQMKLTKDVLVTCGDRDFRGPFAGGQRAR